MMIKHAFLSFVIGTIASSYPIQVATSDAILTTSTGLGFEAVTSSSMTTPVPSKTENVNLEFRTDTAHSDSTKSCEDANIAPPTPAPFSQVGQPLIYTPSATVNPFKPHTSQESITTPGATGPTTLTPPTTKSKTTTTLTTFTTTTINPMYVPYPITNGNIVASVLSGATSKCVSLILVLLALPCI